MDILTQINNKTEYIPLSERVRPKNIDDFFGQNHILKNNYF